MQNTEKKIMLDENRLYYRLILQIITDGRKHGEFKDTISAEDMAYTYESLERGMVYKWCVTGGKSSLSESRRQLLPIYLKQFLI